MPRFILPGAPEFKHLDPQNQAFVLPVLFVIELATRRVCIAGITVQPDAAWMMQVSRNLLDVVDGPLIEKQYLILDRETKHCAEFRQAVARGGIQVIRLPPRSPNLNAFAERYVRSVKEECLSKLIPIGQGMLRRALQAYVAHYHHERNHQGLGNALITPRRAEGHQNGPISRRPRLDGILNYYERLAA